MEWLKVVIQSLKQAIQLKRHSLSLTLFGSIMFSIMYFFIDKEQFQNVGSYYEWIEITALCIAIFFSCELISELAKIFKGKIEINSNRKSIVNSLTSGEQHVLSQYIEDECKIMPVWEMCPIRFEYLEEKGVLIPRDLKRHQVDYCNEDNMYEISDWAWKYLKKVDSRKRFKCRLENRFKRIGK